MPATTMSKYTLPRAEPEAVGMSSARLARIVPALNAAIEVGQLPGAVVAIARHGRLIFHEAVGHLGPDRRAPMPLDALFAIASMTKPITGVAGLLLWEEGRVGLADPIERFLPQLGKPARRGAG
jgi:CubicO group peptidase (beta-lactamase class C family)